MAGCFWELRGRVLLLLLAVGLSPLFCLEDDDSGSSLTEKQCGSLSFEDVDFGKHKLSLNCGSEVQLDLVNRVEAPMVTFKEAVNFAKTFSSFCVVLTHFLDQLQNIGPFWSTSFTCVFC